MVMDWPDGVFQSYCERYCLGVANAESLKETDHGIPVRGERYGTRYSSVG